MFQHEFIVGNFTVWVNGDVSKLPVFASMCPVLANQFMVSAFILTFPRATPSDCKEVDNRPPLAQSGLCGAQWALYHPTPPAQYPSVPRHQQP